MRNRRILLWTATLLWTLQASAQPADGLTGQYRKTADEIIAAAMADEEGWSRLVYLCDRIGHRLSGSPQLEEAIRWSARQMRESGLANVVTPEVMVPHWVRGSENARILSPVERDLPMLGLGGSVGTGAQGIEAEVVAVSSFSELEKLSREAVQGKIVLYDVPWRGYGRTVTYRSQGASRAAALGAKAALLRSVGPVSLQTPHTGAMRYDPAHAKIPMAAITIEGSTLIRRLIDSGETVRVRLYMEAHELPDARSANVIGEIPGREKPEEIVVLGGHIDSWDVGQGAHDDGSGCIASLQAVALLKKLGLSPRRTIRVVFWTNEENGLRGALAYREWIGDALKNHVAAIEMDGGSEKPRGFGLNSLAVAGVAGGSRAVVRRMREIGALLDPIEAGNITWGGGGADIAPLMREGVPGFGLRTVGERYFDWHHTHADTIDKIDPDDFRRNIAALAVLSFVLADMPDRFEDFLKQGVDRAVDRQRR